MIELKYETPNYFETVLAFSSIIKKLEVIGVTVEANSQGFRLSLPYSKEFSLELYIYPQELVSYYNGIMDGIDYEKFRTPTKKPDISFQKDLMQK